MEIILSSEERELLATILEERHRDLQRELSHSDHISFKRMLRQRESVLESLMEKVGVLTAA